MGKHRGVAEGASRSQGAGLYWGKPVIGVDARSQVTIDEGREGKYWHAGEPTHRSLELSQ